METIEPRDKIILVDLDGTLIDNSYNLTDNKIAEVVKKAQRQGWQIGLSSDTPLEALRLWRQRLYMNGPIIAEKGAILEINDQIFIDESDVEKFTLSLQEIERNFLKSSVLLWRGNPVEALKSNIKIGLPGETVVLVNALRTCSLSFFVREVDQEGNLKLNSELTTEIVREARKFYPDFNDLGEDLNYDYGIVIAMRKGVNKRKGTQSLMSELGLKQVAMIGNSMSDFIGEDIARHFAVANASDSFKERCDYIASKPLTKGVSEILLKLTNM